MELRLETALLALLFGALLFSPAVDAQSRPQAALIQMAAGDMDRLLGDIQASTCAVARAYERLVQTSSVQAPPEPGHSRELWIQQDHTIQFNTWGETSAQPVYQSPQPAYYAYGENLPGDKQYRQLGIFRQLAPVLRASHETFGFSWTYLTTADGMMLLYPFLTIEEAVNNYPPTQQVFYTQADFARHRAGWTRPYLDLAGAGMMVTVSCPAFDGATGIGVASNDITLEQLSNRVLDQLASETGEIAYIVDTQGLIIGVSDPALRRGFMEANQDAGRAVAYFGSRVPAGKDGVTAETRWIDSLTDRVLAEVDSHSAGKVLHVEADSHSAWAMAMQHADWIVVLTSPVPQQE